MAQQKFFRLAGTPAQFFLWAIIFFPALVLLAMTANRNITTETRASDTDKPSLSTTSQIKPYQRSEHRYAPDDFELTDRNGGKIRLHQALGSENSVMLNFIFTSCTTVCPLLSASFAQVQQQLGPEQEKVRLISISIDPDHDTPQRLIVILPVPAIVVQSSESTPCAPFPQGLLDSHHSSSCDPSF